MTSKEHNIRKFLRKRQGKFKYPSSYRKSINNVRSSYGNVKAGKFSRHR